MKLSTELPELECVCRSLCEYFDVERIEKESKYCNFIQKQKKMTGMAFFCICIMQGFAASLGTMCGGLKGFSIDMCEQSLNERFTNKAVAFIKRMFSQMLELEISKDVPLNFLSKFSGIIIQDATTINLPAVMAPIFKGSGGNAGKSSVKVDFQMDIQGCMYQMDIRAGVSSDNKLSVGYIKKGALYIRDLGYFNIPFFKIIIESGAYFLSRLKSNSAVYEDIKGKKLIDLHALSQKMAPNDTLRMEVFIGRRKYVPVLLILQKLPAQVIAVKRERAKKDHHRRMTKMTKEQEMWLETNSYITNIPGCWFDALTIIKIYSIRWQIEIMFKAWKSIFKIGEVGKMNSNRVLCMLYGRLTWILLQMKVLNVFKKNIYGVSQKEVSELRGFRQLEEHKNELMEAIKSGLSETWHILIKKMFDLIQSFAIKRRRKKLALFYIIEFQ